MSLWFHQGMLTSVLVDCFFWLLGFAFVEIHVATGEPEKKIEASRVAISDIPFSVWIL